MKVTAIINDELIDEAVSLSGTKTITATLKLALEEYVNKRKLADLNNQIIKEPLAFYKTAEELRQTNRSR